MCCYATQGDLMETGCGVSVICNHCFLWLAFCWNDRCGKGEASFHSVKFEDHKSQSLCNSCAREKRAFARIHEF